MANDEDIDLPELNLPIGSPGENTPLFPGGVPGENTPLFPGGVPGENTPTSPGDEGSGATPPPLGVEDDYMDAVAPEPTPVTPPITPPGSAPQIRPGDPGSRPFRTGSFDESRIQGFSSGPGAGFAGGDTGIDDAIRRGLMKGRMR